MLRDCPHNHHTNDVLVQTFNEGFKPNTKILRYSAAGGQTLETTYDELYRLLN